MCFHCPTLTHRFVLIDRSTLGIMGTHKKSTLDLTFTKNGDKMYAGTTLYQSHVMVMIVTSVNG